MALALFAIGCASAPPAPPNSPAPLSLQERAGIKDRPYSGVIETAGTVTVSTGAIARGDAIVSIPYRYKHTAVLTEDVKGYSITVPGVQAPIGTPGYYVGTFSTNGFVSQEAPSDMWCFLPSVVGGKRKNLCLFRNEPGIAAIAPTRQNPYLWHQFSAATGSFNYVHTPIFERRDIDIPVDLTLEYRFAGWTNTSIRLEELAVGRLVRALRVQRDTDGSAKFSTIAGEFLIYPNDTDSDKATVSWTPFE